MMRSFLFRQVEDELEQLRRSNITAGEERKQLLFEKYPVLSRLDMQRRALVSALFKARNLHSDTAEIQKRIAETDCAINSFMKEKGIGPDSLKVHFNCPLCNDTGVVTNGSRQEKCVCFKQRLLDAAYKDNQMGGARSQTFENFDFRLFSDKLLDEKGNSVRSNMKKIYTYCEKYADQFPDNQRKNILFTGKTGVGKTYLMNCIAARVLQNNHNALILSSGRLFDQLRRYEFSQTGSIADLLEVELLLIDDLGTEPLFNNTTIEYLFMLFNDRTRMGRHLIFTTNLTTDELCARYTQRIVSRIMDRATTVVLNVDGDDLRLKV